MVLQIYGEVYAWGEGYNKVPALIENDKNIIDISKNYYLSDDGVVRKLKDNEEIKLSLNEYDPSEAPILEKENIVQISEGEDSLLLLGESRKSL